MQAMTKNVEGYTPLNYNPDGVILKKPEEPSVTVNLVSPEADDLDDLPIAVKSLFQVINNIDLGDSGKRVLLKSTLQAVIDSIAPGFRIEVALNTQENATSFIEVDGTLAYYLRSADGDYLVNHGSIATTIEKVKP